jgi:hypothetical protein
MRVQLERRGIGQDQEGQIETFREILAAQVHFEIQLADIERLERSALGIDL